jgi:hypothetical protein
MLVKELENSKTKVQREDDFKAIISQLTNKYEEKCAELILLQNDKLDLKGTSPSLPLFLPGSPRGPCIG